MPRSLNSIVGIVHTNTNPSVLFLFFHYLDSIYNCYYLSCFLDSVSKRSEALACTYITIEPDM